MHRATLRRSFIALHLTLGLALLYLSVRTAVHGFQPTAGASGSHEVVLGSVEALGALLFLLPRTLRAGGALLLVTIGVAAAIHGAAGTLRADLLVYAAGTYFVMVHGNGWSARVGEPAGVA